MSKGITFKQQDAAGLRIGLVVAQWNENYTQSLKEAAVLALEESGVSQKDIFVQDVPGAFELVSGAAHMIQKKQPDAVICIGVIIRGETTHAAHLSAAVTRALAQMNASGTCPIILGVLSDLSDAHARARSSGENNHGYGWGKSAVAMALLHKED
jgi:6,7-dimethyl-8-ribityllumazine synthase